jgi:hypothetical protein
MSVMNVSLPEAVHRRLAATAAACGLTMKQALVEATQNWVDQRSVEVASALGLRHDPLSASPAVEVDARRAARPQLAVETTPAQPRPSKGEPDGHNSNDPQSD